MQRGRIGTPRVIHHGLRSLWLVCVALLVACSGGLSQAPAPVRTALEPFAQAGFSCTTPPANGDHSSFSQWECDQTTANGTVLQVVVDGDANHVKQVLAV